MLTENEIRPQNLFDEYLRLSQIDGERLDHTEFKKLSCPSCYSKNFTHEFSKNLFSFSRCLECNSLFCNPRPTENQLSEFYRSSVSAEFWSSKVLPVVENARKEKLFRPKARDIADHLNKSGFKPETICDVGAGHGFLLDELKTHFPSSKMSAIEPGENSVKVLQKKGYEVFPGLLGQETWENKFDVVICFEVLEHVFSPIDFVKKLKKLLRPGGITLVTTLGCDGYDILTLKEKSKSISPPHHLNFPSVNGFQKLFESAGFCKVEIETPGKLDVDIVLNSGERDPFLETLKARGPQALAEFQKFLVEHRLSSHTWIWASK